MPTKMINKGADILVWTNPDEIDYATKAQLYDLATLPFIPLHIAVMPDVHLGKGATVGSVIATQGAVIPAAVGVDIGCGMLAVKSNLKSSDLPDNLLSLRLAIEARVPVGLAMHKYDKLGKKLNPENLTVWSLLEEKKDSSRINRQLGSLGGGNHFIELCLDETDTVWLMLHSGSRGVGSQVATIHIERAKDNMDKILFNQLPSKELAYLQANTKEYQDYMSDLYWCQNYSSLNRQKMYEIIIEVLKKFFPQFQIVDKVISCHHNYIEQETHFGRSVLVTRKGAISAKKGQMGIIPGSMGTKSYIVRGKGEPFSFHSASHGAGRVMSRNTAKETFNLQDFIDQTKGIECRKGVDLIDEIPSAYKDIDSVMANQVDLVEIVHTLKQVLCIKG